MQPFNRIAAGVTPLVLAASSALATISPSGNITGATYNGTDDPWTTNATMFVGNSAPGTLTINAGSVVNFNSDTTVSSASTASASTVTVDGANSTWKTKSLLYLGFSGSATLDITNGGAVNSNVTHLAENTSSAGTVNVGGGPGNSTWTNSGSLIVGIKGTAELNIKGGGAVSDSFGKIADTFGTSTVSVGGGTGASSWTNTTTLDIGINGTGTLNITGGGTVSDTVATLGADTFGIGNVNVGGGTGASIWNNTSFLFVGDVSSGTLNITGGGTVNSVAGSAIGRQNGSTGVVTVGGGTGISTWTNLGPLLEGSFGTSTLNINSGGIVSATKLDGGDRNGSVNFDGGILQITTTDSAFNTISLLAGGGTIDLPTAATTFTVTSKITGAGALTKTGQAALALTAANEYLGDTNIDGGTVLANNTAGSATGSGNVKVNSTGTFGGTGAVSGSVTVNAGGTLAPGASINTLNTGSVSLTDATSAFKAEIDLTSGNLNADLLNVTGTVSLTGSTLNLALLNTPASPAGPLTFLLVNNDGALLDPVLGAFGSVTGLPAGYLATVNYAYDSTLLGPDALGRIGNGNDIAVTLTPVPEPASLTLLGMPLFLTRRRRKIAA